MITNYNSEIDNIAKWYSFNGLPYYFFYCYFPPQYRNLTSESIYARKLIYDFKDGRGYFDIKFMLMRKLLLSFGEKVKNMVLTCIPASTRSKNQARYQEFTKDICFNLGMQNGFNHVKIIQENISCHIGRMGHSIYYLPKEYFKNKNIIVFDDIVTTGKSMKDFTDILAKCGAISVYQISIGKTFNSTYAKGLPIHPYTGHAGMTKEFKPKYV